MSAEFTQLAAFLALTVALEFLRRYFKKKGGEGKLQQLLPKLCTVGEILFIWLFVSDLLPMIFGHGESEALKVELAPSRTMVLGMSISDTVITTWIAMAVILGLALLARFLVLPRLQTVPSGAQNVIETMIDQIDSYASSKAHGLGHALSAYLFTVAVLMVACACVELFGVRSPTADITMTFALALITFVLINYYGVKRKGAVGRVKSLNSQGPIVMVLRVISDMAIPVSMACRLFGNMLGGMIVMDLLYNALGHRAVGVPSVIGLYFNVFHPLIQAFIFITLTLTFIDEAIE